MAKVIRVQGPQHRHYELSSDLLDLAHLTTREEATLATIWIKDRPEGLKLQTLALATNHDRPSCAQSTEKYDCKCPVRH